MRNKSTVHQEMFGHYQSWQQSGLSQKGFCTLHGITFQKFNYWVRKFRSEDTKVKTPSGGFLSVAIKQPTFGCEVEIIRVDGTRIQFHGNVDAGFIRSLLD